MPVFPIRSLMLILPWAAIGVALAIVAVGAAKGKNVFKNQAVAWLTTIVMVCVAIGIGYAKAPVSNPAHSPDYPPETAPPAAAESYVWDDAGVLSSQTKRVLDQRNERLWDRHSVSIGVVTCNYEDDLGDYAMRCVEDMGLGGYDMIVALDIGGENYWLIQGNDLRRAFTDDDCSNYAYDYMEDYFARGMYDDAVLALTEALEVWYADYYG